MPAEAENGNELIGGFWRRFWAYMIDTYAVIGLLTPISYFDDNVKYFSLF
ncbi:MAG: hypothetical protein LLG93_06790 [Deltaproteobacteria bacterium]|nr:hypothetical protein [Deltaproteobacteria bacterium]